MHASVDLQRICCVAVLAYRRQNCTTSKLTTRTIILVRWPKDNTMQYLDIHAQERTKTTLARTMKDYITQQSSHTYGRTHPTSQTLSRKQSMLCHQRNTLRNIIGRVFLFQHSSWHLQKEMQQRLLQKPVGTAPKSAATSRVQMF